MRSMAQAFVPAQWDLIRGLILMAVSSAGMLAVVGFLLSSNWWDGLRAFCGTLVLLLAMLLAA